MSEVQNLTERLERLANVCALKLERADAALCREAIAWLVILRDERDARERRAEAAEADWQAALASADALRQTVKRLVGGIKTVADTEEPSTSLSRVVSRRAGEVLLALDEVSHAK